MKIIAIRGLPGSGKTEVAHELGHRLGCEDIIHVDRFKVEYLRQNITAHLDAALTYAQGQTIVKIDEHQKNKTPLLIVEEIFKDPNFIQMIMKYCSHNQINISWIQLKREFRQILKTERMRDRPIKNSKEQLEVMQEKMGKIIIPGEIIIMNKHSIENTVSEIIPQVLK